MPKNWSVKSVCVSKLIICSYPEVIDGRGFDLFLRKFGLSESILTSIQFRLNNSSCGITKC